MLQCLPDDCNRHNRGEADLVEQARGLAIIKGKGVRVCSFIYSVLLWSLFCLVHESAHRVSPVIPCRRQEIIFSIDGAICSRRTT